MSLDAGDVNALLPPPARNPSQFYNRVLADVRALLGMGLAYAAGRYFESILAGVRPGDPLTFGVAALFTGVLALSGSLVPTLRAVRVDPCKALRAD